MSQFSDYTESNILQTTLRGQSFPAPSGTYIALLTSSPGDSGDMSNELGDSNYERQDAAQGGSIDSGWDSPSGGQTKNSKVIQFPPINDSTVTVSHFAIMDAKTGGNMLYHAPLTSSKTLEVGDVLSWDIGSITVTVD